MVIRGVETAGGQRRVVMVAKKKTMTKTKMTTNLDSVLIKIKGKDGLTYTVDPTVTFQKRNKFAQMDLIQLGD